MSEENLKGWNPDAAGQLLERLSGMDDEAAEWYTALLFAAADYGGDLGQAMALADQALAQDADGNVTGATVEAEPPARRGRPDAPPPS